MWQVAGWFMNKLLPSKFSFSMSQIMLISLTFHVMKYTVFPGISHSAKGYCMISVLETMKTYSAEEGLTEEAIVTKLRTCRYHHLLLHSSLRHNISGLDTF